MLTSEYICVIMRKRKQEACFLKARKEEIKMRHCQYCDALNPDDALQCGNCGKSLPPAGKNIVSSSDKIPENAGLKLQVLARIIFAVILICGEILGYLNIKEAHFAVAGLSEYDCLACVRGIVRKCMCRSLLSVSTE